MCSQVNLTGAGGSVAKGLAHRFYHGNETTKQKKSEEEKICIFYENMRLQGKLGRIPVNMRLSVALLRI